MVHPHDVTRPSVEENLYRVQSGAVALTATAFAVTFYLPLLAVLVYDFAVRVFLTPKASPFFLLSKFVTVVASSPDPSVDAKSRVFATKIWLGVSVLALYFGLSGDHNVALFLSAVLATCMATDALFNFCVGCEIYALLKRFNISITSLKD